MGQTIESKNKALVLEAFGTLFNQSGSNEFDSGVCEEIASRQRRY
jgi:hypothetical protein